MKSKIVCLYSLLEKVYNPFDKRSLLENILAYLLFFLYSFFFINLHFFSFLFYFEMSQSQSEKRTLEFREGRSRRRRRSVARQRLTGVIN